MEQMDSNNQALAQVRFDLTEVTSTSGWRRVSKFAETVIRDLEKKAIQEEDDTKGTGFRRDARGARVFWDDLLARIELAKSFTEPTTDDFLDIATD